jgi:hypothetical protein
LFVAWQDPATRSWYPIARLTHDDGIYRFIFTNGARKAQNECGFMPPTPFDSLEQVYESDVLFPLFANRVPKPNRPDYRDYVECLNLPLDKDDPMLVLSRNGGRRETDSYEVFPCPEPGSDGAYHIHFFAHGVRHLPDESLKRIEQLKRGDELLMAWDFQNPYDRRALMLLTSDRKGRDRYILGFCPRYLNADAFELLQANMPVTKIAVERVNPPPAPLQLRLLCNMTAEWPGAEFRPFSTSEYQPLVGVADTSSPVT